MSVATSLHLQVHAMGRLCDATAGHAANRCPTQSGWPQCGHCDLVGPHVLSVVWTATVWSKLTLPHHDAATEVTDFFAVLVETFGLNQHCAAIIL